MTTNPTPLLREQFAEALEDARETGNASSWLEAAALLGLLRRAGEPDPEGAATVRVSPEHLRAAAEEAADALMGVDEGCDPAVSWDRLSALDECLAAAEALDRPDLVREAAEAATGTVRAFWRQWQPHADAATGLLAKERPPMGSPAWQLWAAVEATRWQKED